jgi:DNA-binding MarR family transcriptional regulator
MTTRSVTIEQGPRRSTRREADGALHFGPLGERLGYILRRAQVAVFQDFHDAFADVDIRPAQYSVLTLVECNPGLSQTHVAKALGIKKPNLVAMIDELEGRALVARATAETDRRSHALVLTAKGRTLMRRLHRRAAAHEQRIVRQIGAAAHRRLFAELAAIASLRER